MDYNLIIAGGSISTIIYNTYTNLNIKFDDIDLYYFNTLKTPSLITVLYKLYLYFKKKKLNFICVHYHKYRYSIQSNKIHKQDKQRVKINKKYFFCKKILKVFNCFILTDDQCKRYNISENMNLFSSCPSQLNQLFNIPQFYNIDIDTIDYIYDNEQLYQMIEIGYNYLPIELENKISILLSSFDISICQSALIKNENNEYITV